MSTRSNRRVLRRCALSSLLALSLWCADANAWSRRAHALVGDLASQLLAPEATLEVDFLLRDDVGADGRPSGDSTLGQVSSWADDLRASPEGRETFADHFDDIPVCGPDAGLVHMPPVKPWCPDGRCASEWLKKQVALLGDRSQSLRTRAEALKWVVHLVGDLHQPLHAANDGDRGGNDVKITWFGRRADEPVDGKPQTPYNLHTAWDRLIPNRVLDAREAEAGSGADALRAMLPDDGTRRAWSEGTIDDWTLESHAIARDFVYPTLPGGFRCGVPNATVVPLDARYALPASDVVAVQLRRAGVRLAKLLNDTLVAR